MQAVSTRSVIYVVLVAAAVLALVLVTRPHSSPHKATSVQPGPTPTVRSTPNVSSSSNVAADLQVRSSNSALAQVHSTPAATPSPQVRSSPSPAADILVPSSPNVAADLQGRSAHPDLPPGVPYATPTDPVQIQSVTFSPTHVHAGDIASARILTTSNAAALTARIGTYQVNVPKVAPGTFALTITVPNLLLPQHQFQIVVTAIRADGATAQRVFPVDVDY